jgi:hypothetical protein
MRKAFGIFFVLLCMEATALAQVVKPIRQNFSANSILSQMLRRDADGNLGLVFYSLDTTTLFPASPANEWSPDQLLNQIFYQNSAGVKGLGIYLLGDTDITLATDSVILGDLTLGTSGSTVSDTLVFAADATAIVTSGLAPTAFGGDLGFSFQTNAGDFASGDYVAQFGDSLDDDLVRFSGDGDVLADDDIIATGDVQTQSGVLFLGLVGGGATSITSNPTAGKFTISSAFVATGGADSPLAVDFDYDFADADSLFAVRDNIDVAAADLFVVSGIGTVRIADAGIYTFGSGDIGLSRYDDSGTAVFRVVDDSADSAAILSIAAVEAVTAEQSAPNVITAAESGKIITNEGATAMAFNTLPPATQGSWVTIVIADPDPIESAQPGMRLTANTGDRIRIGGTLSAVAGYIESLSTGSYAHLVAINDTTWVALGFDGSWTVQQ